MPVGWVNMHLTGTQVRMQIRKTGGFEDVPSPTLGYCAYWETPKSGGKGVTLHSCRFALFGQKKIAAFFRIGNKGGKTLSINPGRIYLDPQKITQHRAKELLLQRANFIASLLAKTGWQLTDPDIAGTVHIGKEKDPLAMFIPSGTHDERQMVSVDFSPGTMTCETEIENGADDETVRIYANLPQTLKEIKDVQKELQLVIAQQTDIISALVANSDKHLLMTSRLATQSFESAQPVKTPFTGEGYL